MAAMGMQPGCDRYRAGGWWPIPAGPPIGATQGVDVVRPLSSDGPGPEVEADDRAEVGRIRAFIAERRPPAGPIDGQWALGVGTVLAAHPRVPGAVRAGVRRLDRFGGLTIARDFLAVDGLQLPWRTIKTIQTVNLAEYLLSGALRREVSRLPLPRFPGRGRVVEAVSSGALTLLFAAAHDQVDRGIEVRVPAQVDYRGALAGRRSLSPGMFASLLLADPAVNRCFYDTAGAHGVAVQALPSEAAGAAERAAALRAAFGRLQRGGTDAGARQLTRRLDEGRCGEGGR